MVRNIADLSKVDPSHMGLSSVDLSIVVPVKDEESSVILFLETSAPYCDELGLQYEFVFGNDGSIDSTLAVLTDAMDKYPQLRIVNLSRNFGKELALTAGLDHARGRAIIPMDVDLQDPPELIPKLYAKYQDGFDSVIAVRSRRDGDSWGKKFFAKLFHRIFRKVSDVKIIENAGDFRLISRRVLDVVKPMPERTRFMKGMLSWPGFSSAVVYYERPERASGDTKWAFSKLWTLALDGIFSFSTLPLKVWTYLGFSLALTSVVYMVFTIIKTIVYGIDVPGYASLLTVTLLMGGVNLMGIGILGEYVSRLFMEVKGRPLYVVESVRDAGDIGEQETKTNTNTKADDSTDRV